MPIIRTLAARSLEESRALVPQDDLFVKETRYIVFRNRKAEGFGKDQRIAGSLDFPSAERRTFSICLETVKYE